MALAISPKPRSLITTRTLSSDTGFAVIRSLEVPSSRSGKSSSSTDWILASLELGGVAGEAMAELLREELDDAEARDAVNLLFRLTKEIQ